MKTKGFLSLALTLLLSLAIGASAFAAEDSDSTYGYLAGRQKNNERHAQYEQLAALSTDASRSAFFAATDIGGACNDTRHLDTKELVDAGLIDQETADGIQQYAATKHTQLSDRYGSMENMTPTERHASYAGLDRSGGDSVDNLLAANIITQKQAEAIKAYLAK